MTGRDFFCKNKHIISFAVSVIRLMPFQVRKLFFTWFRNFPGKIGILIRYLLFKSINPGAGVNICIKEKCFIYNPEFLHLGDNVSIHPMCYIDALGGVNIGSNVSIAHSSSLISFDHGYYDIDLPIKYNPIIKSSIIIEDDVWLGCGVRILSNVRICTRVIVAAGSVVTKDLVSNSIYGGVPAVRIKEICGPVK